MDGCTTRKRYVESTELLNLTECPSVLSCEQLSQSFFGAIDMDPVEAAQMSFTGPLQDGILFAVILMEEMPIAHWPEMHHARKGTCTSVE